MTRHAALHDPLTGLPNRTLALDRLAQALARRQRERIDVAVFVLDVDGFKLINDSLGHAAGDEVLLALAPRLTAAVRTTDTVARLGRRRVRRHLPRRRRRRAGRRDVAERLAAAVSRPLVLEQRRALLHGQHRRHAGRERSRTRPESLLGDADAAMYRAKARGRGGYELFDEAMRTTLMARVRTETELRRALDRGELEVYYQPVIDLATGRPVSTEALVRWQHPERGLVDAARVHPDRRGDRADRPARAARARAGLPPDRGLAARHRPGDRRVGQRLRAPGAQPAVPRPGGGDRRAQRAARPGRSRSRSPRPC